MAESKKQPKVIGGINWSTRAKSKTFWVAIVSAIAVFANQVTSAFGVDYSTQIEQGVNIVGSILTFLAMIGVVVDNNTKGIKDSEIVQTDYVQPRDSNNPNHYVQWQTDENAEHSNLREENEQLRKEKEKEQRDIKEAMHNDSDEEGELLAPERKLKDVEEFDTTQPFTDDSDEVEFDVADYEDEREVALGESRFHDDSELKDGKEDESKKEDFIENIDSVVVDDNVDDNKEDNDKVVKKTVTKEVTEDEKESDK